MAQYVFGAGSMFVTPLQDANGAVIANPTPVKVFDLQEASIDLGADMKKLYGQNSFPIAVGVAKRDISVKLKQARVLGRLWNTLFFGQTVASGLSAVSVDTTAVVPTTPFQVTVVPPSSGTFTADLGVTNAAGDPLTRVASAPAANQYTVTPVGVYTFNTAQASQTVFISFAYNATVTGAGRQTVVNLPMGFAPTFRADLHVQYLGRIAYLNFPLCIASKFGMSLKNEDFNVPEFEFGAFDNGSGQVMSWSLSESF